MQSQSRVASARLFSSALPYFGLILRIVCKPLDQYVSLASIQLLLENNLFQSQRFFLKNEEIELPHCRHPNHLPFHIASWLHYSCELFVRTLSPNVLSLLLLAILVTFPLESLHTRRDRIIPSHQYPTPIFYDSSRFESTLLTILPLQYEHLCTSYLRYNALPSISRVRILQLLIICNQSYRSLDLS